MQSLSRRAGRSTCRQPSCASCLQVFRQKPIHGVIRAPNAQKRHKHIAQPGEQATPLTGYYEALLGDPVSTVHPSAKQRQAAADDAFRKEREARTQLVFGSRLAGPLEHKSAKQRQSTNIAGVLVPPRPEEPDNCCMSGCANCVWDLFREDLEEWAAKAGEAQAKLRAQGKLGTADEHRLKTFTGGATKDTGLPGGAASMDDDGGGSETNWSLDLDKAGAPKAGSDLFAAIPVGIKQYMLTEKMLKEKHAKEARTGT